MASDNSTEQIKPTRDELSSFVEIGKALTSSLDIHDVLSSIMKQVERLIKPKIWSLLLVDEPSGDLMFEIVVSPVSENLKGLRLKRGEGVAGWVALHGKPLLLPDVRTDKRFSEGIDTKVSFVTRSIICVPLIIKDRIIGVIELINSFDEQIFSEADLVVLAAIADFAAIALENSRIYDRLNELVITDDLTGLFNARYFKQLIDTELETALQSGTHLSLLFLDLDRLKSINDTHGHLVGSRMLSEFGRLIGANIRPSDKAARYGGDEFAIVLPETDKAEALIFAHRLCELVRCGNFSADDGQPIRLSASLGVASFPEDAQSRTELIRAADIAMYAAKRAGRGVIRYYGQ